MVDNIKNILEDALPVLNQKTVTLNTNNGLLNVDALNKQKQLFIKESLQYTQDEIIDINNKYPMNDLMDVHLSTDIVILKYSDFLTIKEYIDGIT